MMKRDSRGYKPRVLVSNGVGSGMKIVKPEEETPEERSYTLRNGRKIAMPMYYRMKMYTEEQRMNMWTKRLDEGDRYVAGMKIKNTNTRSGFLQYEKAREYWDKEAIRKGYKSESKYNKKEYEKSREMLGELKIE